MENADDLLDLTLADDAFDPEDGRKKKLLIGVATLCMLLFFSGVIMLGWVKGPGEASDTKEATSVLDAVGGEKEKKSEVAGASTEAFGPPAPTGKVKTPTPTKNVSATPAPTAVPTAALTSTPAPTSAPAATATPTPQPTDTPTPTPTNTPQPTDTPTPTPTPTGTE